MAEKPKVDPDLCTGCGICVDTCPTGALAMNEDETLAVLANPDDCDSCASCAEACPAEAITMVEQ